MKNSIINDNTNAIKREPLYTFYGYGFPVTLLNVPVRLFQNEWILDVDLNLLETTVLLELAQKVIRFTGNEIYFIRHSFHMNVNEFAKRFYITPLKVKNWERVKDSFPKMNWTTEKDIRLEIACRHSSALAFVELYEDLETTRSTESDDIMTIVYKKE